MATGADRHEAWSVERLTRAACDFLADHKIPVVAVHERRTEDPEGGSDLVSIRLLIPCSMEVSMDWDMKMTRAIIHQGAVFPSKVCVVVREYVAAR